MQENIMRGRPSQYGDAPEKSSKRRGGKLSARELERRHDGFLDLWTGEPLKGLDADERSLVEFPDEGVVNHYAAADAAGCPYADHASPAREHGRVDLYRFTENGDGTGRTIWVGFDSDTDNFIIQAD